MASNKLTIRQRLQTLITGSVKDFIPQLSNPSLLDFDNNGAPLVTYTTKSEQLHTNIGWVRAANKAITEPISAVPLKLRKRVKKDEWEDIPEHPILDLIENPHVALNGTKMRDLNHTYLNLTGEAYMLMRKAGTPFEVTKGNLPDSLEILPSHLVQFKRGETRYSDSIVKYGKQDFQINTVLRDYNPNPDNPYVGISIVSAAASSVDLDQQMQSWNRRMFQNNARPGLVFSLDGERVDPNASESIKKQLDDMFNGDNTFKSIVLENGKVTPYMLTPQDLDFLSSREFSRDEILAIFKVPPSMLGMSKDFNRANIDGSRYIHILLNVIPRLEAEIAMWNQQLVKKYDPNLELYYENPLPEDVDAKIAESKAGTNLWMTIDETRKEYGLDALPNKLGDQLYVPNTWVKLTSVADGTATPPASSTQPSAEEPASGNEGKKSGPKLAA